MLPNPKATNNNTTESWFLNSSPWQEFLKSSVFSSPINQLSVNPKHITHLPKYRVRAKAAHSLFSLYWNFSQNAAVNKCLMMSDDYLWWNRGHKSAATVPCCHANMDQNLWMSPAPCWIYGIKHEGREEAVSPSTRKVHLMRWLWVTCLIMRK